jgi:hypothetical protein
MEFGSKYSPGKQLREIPAIATDRNGSMRLEMARDHPMLVQHSRAPVDWLPLQAYPDTYFSVAMISLTGEFSGGLLERIREISPFARQPCV